MIANHHIWRVWAYTLHRWGLEDLVATLLEASGSMAMLGAQVVYLGQPLLYSVLPAGHLEALVGLLEDRQQAVDFVTFLRKGINA